MDRVLIVKGIFGWRTVDGFLLIVPPTGQSLSKPSSRVGTACEIYYVTNKKTLILKFTLCSLSNGAKAAEAVNLFYLCNVTFRP